MQQLKTKTDKIKFRLINNKIFSLINDKTADFNYILLHKMIKQKPSFVNYSLFNIKIET